MIDELVETVKTVGDRVIDLPLHNPWHRFTSVTSWQRRTSVCIDVDMPIVQRILKSMLLFECQSTFSQFRYCSQQNRRRWFHWFRFWITDSSRRSSLKTNSSKIELFFNFLFLPFVFCFTFGWWRMEKCSFETLRHFLTIIFCTWGETVLYCPCLFQ